MDEDTIIAEDAAEFGEKETKNTIWPKSDLGNCARRLTIYCFTWLKTLSKVNLEFHKLVSVPHIPYTRIHLCKKHGKRSSRKRLKIFIRILLTRHIYPVTSVETLLVSLWRSDSEKTSSTDGIVDEY